jgi:sulfite reductase (ferredoxin)
MPSFVLRLRALLNSMGLGREEVMMRVTGCPNGCARPYMSELALVGDGPSTYQMWVGGSPILEARTGFVLKDRVPQAAWEDTLQPVLSLFKDERSSEMESFGDFCARVGQSTLAALVA